MWARRARSSGVLAIGVLLAGLAGCSADGDATPTPSESAGSAAGVDAGDAATNASDVLTSQSSASTVAETSVPPEPTGVAGIDDPNAFCGAWARYAGSVQIIAVAGAFGDLTPAQLATYEVAASGSVLAALVHIESTWPEALRTESDAVLQQRLGPLRRRMTAVSQAFTDAGADDALRQSVASAWDRLLATRDPDDPAPTIPFDAAVLDTSGNVIAAAADAVATDLPPFANDPTLNVTAVETPLTDAYLADSCSALAGSGVGDDL